MTDGPTIVQFPTAEVEPTVEEFLEGAKEWELESAIVLGYTDDGYLRMGGTIAEVGELHFALALALQAVLKSVELHQLDND